MIHTRTAFVVTLLATLLCAAPLRLQAQDRWAPGGSMPQEAPLMMMIPATGEQVPLPTTDDEALRLLDYGAIPLTQSMRGLYQTHRAQGDDVLVALAKTLHALTAASKKAQDAERKPH